jgi:hypothetical protein
LVGHEISILASCQERGDLANSPPLQAARYNEKVYLLLFKGLILFIHRNKYYRVLTEDLRYEEIYLSVFKSVYYVFGICS